MEAQTKNILIGCTGSVATIKLTILCDQLKLRALSAGLEIDIKVITTEHAKHFFDPKDLAEDITVYSDEQEWAAWKQRGDPVVHIDLGKWADIMIIAPLDANSLAKIANGLCDNLLLCTVRAWDFSKPLFFCPAMNTRMWDHPLTKQQIDVLKGWGYVEVPCVTKSLMCGDTGNGAMAEVGTIINFVFEIFEK